jgi:hypothetical protein
MLFQATVILIYVCLVELGAGRDSSVGIATRYGLDGPGIESRRGGGEIFRTGTNQLLGPPSLLYKGYRVFSGVKQPGRGIDHPPLLAPRLKNE